MTEKEPTLDTKNDAAENRSTVVHLLLHWEKVQPNKVYFTQPLDDGSVLEYTWKQVTDQVRRMANHLHSLGLPARSQVAIYGKNSAHWIMADLAILMAGHVTVPLYPTLNAETAEYVLEHSESKLLFIGKLDGTADSWNQVKEVIPQDMPCIALPLAPQSHAKRWDDIIAEVPPLENLTLPAAEDLATIMYTSGSTGKPKGVMQNFKAMLKVADLSESDFSITSEDRLLSYLPLAHAAERVLIETVSLYTGCHIFFANKLDTFQADLQRASPTFFFSVPRLWTKFYQGVNEKMPPAKQKILFKVPLLNRIVKKKILEQLGLANVRVAVTGSAPLPQNIIAWYRKLGLELLEGYGMTENVAYSHANKPGANRSGTVGRANVEVECVIDDNGEILVKSPGTMMGYFKNPEKTAEDITPEDFLRTGDMGEIDAQGYLKITGRVKDIFKTAKGKYVAPVPIEQKLAASTLIETICVGGGCLPQPVGMLMLSEDLRRGALDAADKERVSEELNELLADVNAKLEGHEKLACLVVVKEAWDMENGLLTPTMKVRRQAVEDHYAAQFEKWASLRQTLVWE